MKTYMSLLWPCLLLSGACASTEPDVGRSEMNQLALPCEEVQQMLRECVWETWSIGSGQEHDISSYLDSCAEDGDPESLELYLEGACEGDDAPLWCSIDIATLYEDAVPACRATMSPIFLMQLELEDDLEVAVDGTDWTEQDGVFSYRREKLVDTLPWSRAAGRFSATADEDGRVELEYTVGDADVRLTSAMALPMQYEAQQLRLQPGIYDLSLSGADQASGAWGARGRLVVQVAR